MSSASIDFNCPHCQHHMESDISICGTTIPCPECKGDIIIPERKLPEAKVADVHFHEDAGTTPGTEDPEEVQMQAKPIFRAYYDRLFYAVLLTALVITGLVYFDLVHWFFAAVGSILVIGSLTVLSIWIATLTVDYSITNERFFRRKGLLTRHMDEVELFRIKDVQLRQNLFQRIFKCGTVVIFSSDESTPELHMERIDQPIEVKERIRAAFRDARKREGVQAREFSS